jgi:hypothetical protein
MILLLIYIMFLSIMFLVCFSNMLDIVILDTKFVQKFAKRLAQYSSELSGRHYVSMVLKYCLLANALYITGHVADRDCDTLVKSFVVHSSFVE